jgi:hypothetical protein
MIDAVYCRAFIENQREVLVVRGLCDVVAVVKACTANAANGDALYGE